MVTAEVGRNIVGIIGNVISFGLFLSPVPTMWQIYKNKSVQEFSVIPYICTLLNCAMWVLYGQPNVNPDHLLVVTINGTGLGIEAIYIIIFAWFAAAGFSKMRRTIAYGLLAEIVFTAIIVSITYFVFHTTEKRTTFVGVVCVIFNIVMYASPLTVMKKVITTKSVEYMPFWLSFTNLLNGACWTIYACLGKVDLWMVIPNGLGTLSGVVQLVLYVFYYFKSTPCSGGDNSSEGGKPPKNVEIVVVGSH